MRWDATDEIDLIDTPLLMIAGSKADSLYMTEDAFAKAIGGGAHANMVPHPEEREARLEGCRPCVAASKRLGLALRDTPLRDVPQGEGQFARARIAR